MSSQLILLKSLRNTIQCVWMFMPQEKLTQISDPERHITESFFELLFPNFRKAKRLFVPP